MRRAPAPATERRSRSGHATASGAQSFELMDAGGGAFAIVNTHANKCVDVNAQGTTNGTKIQLWDCNQSPAQSFYLEDAGGASSPS